MKTFTQTCNKLYDRHQYVITFSNGQEQLFADYETMRTYWFTHCRMRKMIVSVKDIPLSKPGFA